MASAGTTSYRIDGSQALPPFFMSLVGVGNGWAFLSSTGAITAGRTSPDQAIFPYLTDDQLLDAAGRAGSATRIVVTRPNGVRLAWLPFSRDHLDPQLPERAVEKTILSDEIILEERHADTALVVRIGWRMSPRFGLVRTTTLRCDGAAPQRLRVVDGVLNVLPPGVSARTQRELSNLLDAYKLSELDRDARLMWTRLNSGLTDRAEPFESLLASTAWVSGFDSGSLSIDPTDPGTDICRGGRANLLVQGDLELQPGESRSWRIVVDTDRDAAQVATLLAELRGGHLVEALEADLAQARAGLTRLVASADGVQVTADAAASAHHASCVLFNIMRGGVPATGLGLDRSSLDAFLSQRNRVVRAKHAHLLAALPERLTIEDLRQLAAASTDPDVRRLVGSYLPLTFSRRHGDPTRPWNTFRIDVADRHGHPRLGYEGNWRDIFQNWEALVHSFPSLTDVAIRTFLDAMTIDGYNPYRISMQGVDWEVPEPENPWSNIGYWSDHQVPYLHALLVARERLLGPWSAAALTAPDHVYADVPYRIRGFRALVSDPASTIDFDGSAHEASLSRCAAVGGDGRLVVDADGELVRATMVEKLLLIVAAKLVNLVPGGGIWMNTQRPEWNDANNALVGRGVSVVSVAQLIGFVDQLTAMLERLPAGTAIPVSGALGTLWAELTHTLSTELPLLDGGIGPADRARVMEQLGTAGERYRQVRYADPGAHESLLELPEAIASLGTARRWLLDVVERSWRDDGLLTSYQTLAWAADRVLLEPLGPMLEGQVAVLASGVLPPDRALALCEALRRSSLWCPQRRTYLLYPDRRVGGFLERNRIPASAVQEIPLLGQLIAADDRRLVVAGADGVPRFAGELHTARDVVAALDEVGEDPRFGAVAPLDRDAVIELFEAVFDHASFTGRAGSFFAYEGLGSVYWHMVSKLLLAVRRLMDDPDLPPSSWSALAQAAEEIRAGLGHAKTPAQFGAFPVDPYSHTPNGHGARQPGMTGQVKEDILIRWSELGVRFRDGTVSFRPDLVHPTEWTASDTTMDVVDVDGSVRAIGLPAGSLALTWCQVPIVYRKGGEPAITVHHADGDVRVPGWTLPLDHSADLGGRRGTVRQVTVWGG